MGNCARLKNGDIRRIDPDRFPRNQGLPNHWNVVTCSVEENVEGSLTIGVRIEGILRIFLAFIFKSPIRLGREKCPENLRRRAGVDVDLA
jgi:hypothetical protein